MWNQIAGLLLIIYLLAKSYPLRFCEWMFVIFVRNASCFVRKYMFMFLTGTSCCMTTQVICPTDLCTHVLKVTCNISIFLQNSFYEYVIQWTISPVSHRKMRRNLDNLRRNFQTIHRRFCDTILYHYCGLLKNIFEIIFDKPVPK